MRVCIHAYVSTHTCTHTHSHTHTHIHIYAHTFEPFKSLNICSPLFRPLSYTAYLSITETDSESEPVTHADKPCTEKGTRSKYDSHYINDVRTRLTSISFKINFIQRMHPQLYGHDLQLEGEAGKRKGESEGERGGRERGRGERERQRGGSTERERRGGVK